MAKKAPIKAAICARCLEPMGDKAKPWSAEELAEAIQARQVILRDVDGGTRIGTITPADAAMLARVSLSRPAQQQDEVCVARGELVWIGPDVTVGRPPEPRIALFGLPPITRVILTDLGQRVEVIVRPVNASPTKGA